MLTIDRRQALVLSKLLHEALRGPTDPARSQFQTAVSDLAYVIDDHLVNGDEERDDDEQERLDPDRTQAPPSARDQADDAVSGEGGASPQGSWGEVNASLADVLYAQTISPVLLHSLKAAKTDAGALEFDFGEGSRWASVIIDGESLYTAAFLTRRSHELEILDSDSRHHFYEVKRYPREWARFLPLNQTVKVFA